jgi:hypothetical protein
LFSIQQPAFFVHLEISMKNYVQITIRTRSETKNIDYGRQFLQIMIDSDSRLEPEYLDCVLTRSNTTPFENLEAGLARWATREMVQGYTTKVDAIWGAKWKRKSRPSYSCEINHTSAAINGDLIPADFGFTAKWNASVNWADLFRSLCALPKTQIAMLHHFTGIEMTKKNSSFEIGSLKAWFDPKFPDISWAMMFGDDFVYAVDVQKLTAHGFPVEAVGSGYLVRVTDSLLDVSQRFDYFCERRELLRTLLPASIFPDREAEEANRQMLQDIMQQKYPTSGASE